MKTMTLDEFHAACKAQASSSDQIVFRCPRCHTLQSARDLIAAGAGVDMTAVEKYLGFSCIGRFTGAGPAKNKTDRKGCDWMLGGLFRLHTMEVVTPDGKRHPHFELATREEADAHRASVGSRTMGDGDEA